MFLLFFALDVAPFHISVLLCVTTPCWCSSSRLLLVFLFKLAITPFHNCYYWFLLVVTPLHTCCFSSLCLLPFFFMLITTPFAFVTNFIHFFFCTCCYRSSLHATALLHAYWCSFLCLLLLLFAFANVLFFCLLLFLFMFYCLSLRLLLLLYVHCYFSSTCFFVATLLHIVAPCVVLPPSSLHHPPPFLLATQELGVDNLEWNKAFSNKPSIHLIFLSFFIPFFHFFSLCFFYWFFCVFIFVCGLWCRACYKLF